MCNHTVTVHDLPRTGHLILPCNMSHSRSIESEHFGSLALPVGEFLALEHGLEYWGVADHDQVKVTALYMC